MRPLDINDPAERGVGNGRYEDVLGRSEGTRDGEENNRRDGGKRK
jgi:hypothetical protein